MDLNDLEQACIKRAKRNGCGKVSISGTGLTLDDFNNAAWSLYEKGLLEEEPTCYEEGMCYLILIREDFLDLL